MAFPDGFGRRCALVIQSGQVTDNEVNFPLLVTEDTLPSEIFDADGSYPALNGGGDIRFSSDEAGDTQLACEIESFITDNDPVNGKAAIWVKVPSLSSSSNQTIYIWYSKAGESQPAEDNAYGKENVWDSNFCYDDKTEVLTDNGWKFFAALKHNDKIATLNQNTEELEYHIPTNYISYDYNGKLFVIANSNQISLAVIPDHNMYVAKRKGNGFGEHELCKAKNIFEKQVRYKKDAIWIGKYQKTFILPSITHKYDTSNQYKKGIIRHIHIPEIEIDMNLWVEFLGYFISEGSCVYTDTGSHKRYIVNVSQSLCHKKNRTLIRKCFNKLPFKFSENDNGFIINNKQLASYMKRFGHSIDEHIPKDIKSLSKTQLIILFDALMLGDGASDGTSYSTISKRLADDFQEILLKIGTAGNVYKYANNRINPIYTVSVIIGKKFGQLQPHVYNKDKSGRTAHNEWQDYNGKVYSVEVPNHIVYVRRKGKGVWSGNCMVQHMNQTPDGTAGEIVDSTSNDNDGTTSGMDSADQVTGQIDGSLDFDGGNDYVNTGSIQITTNEITISAWVREDGGSSLRGLVTRYRIIHDWLLRTGSSRELTWYPFAAGSISSSANIINDGELHYVTASHKSGEQIIYVDTDIVASGAVAGSLLTTSNDVYVGLDYISDRNWGGPIDEVRISNVARSAGWIATEYNNQNAPGTFLIEGTPETPGAPPIEFIPQIIMF